jgi:hypothetical protein
MSKTRSNARISHSVFASLAMLTGAGMVTPHPCFAGDDLTSASLRTPVVNCAPATAPSRRECHLDVNTPPPKGGGFELRLKAGLVRLWRT